jgi:hypothetical protein
MKSKKGEMNMGLMLMLVFGIILSLALIPAIFNEQSAMTTKNVATDESVSVASARIHGDDFNGSVSIAVPNAIANGLDDDWKIAECPLESIVVTNASGTALTVTTDYTLSPTTGYLNIVNSTANIADFAGSNISLIDYSYCLDGYNTNSGSRGIAQLIGLMATFALLAFVIGYGVKEWMNS